MCGRSEVGIHRFALSTNQGIDFAAAEDLQDGGDKEKRKTLMRTQNVCKLQETIHNSEKLLHRETFSQSLWWVALVAFLGKDSTTQDVQNKVHFSKENTGHSTDREHTVTRRCTNGK